MTRPNIQIPKEFAINGEKADFTQEKMQTGFDKLNPDIFAGDNINKFIDDTYKGLNGVLDLYNGVVLHEMTTTYDDKAVVGKFIENNFKLYRSLVNDNTGHEVTETEYWEEVALGGGSSLPIGSTVVLDRVLSYEESQGLALQGTYVYKTAIAGERYGYPDFYNTYVDYKNNATATQTTLGSSTITIYNNANGLKFYNIADKGVIDTWFNSTGIADFYGVDEANERIFLPRNNKFWQFTTNTNEVNNYVEAGLPNITGSIGVRAGVDTHNDGAFSYSRGTSTAQISTSGSGEDVRWNFNASLSNPIYGNSTTVQPPASKKLLYYVVGNTVSDTSWIDVVTQVQGGVKDLEDKTQEGIERLKASSNALTTTQITNCITEIPQDIKLELNDGVLTLKAGSKVYMPNGFEADGTTPKFDEVVIESDKQWNYGTGEFVILISNTGGITGTKLEHIYSGTSSPTIVAGVVWYDTTNNIIKRSQTGTDWEEKNYALPISVVTTSSGSVTAIDQTFNGFGYIGSTIYVLPNVKGLIPNGRNEDGSLNNREFLTYKVVIRTKTGNLSNEDIRLNDIQTDIGNLEYNEQKNWNTAKGSFRDFAVVGKISMANNVITSFQPKLPFRAVDYNTPHIIETYQNGASWYRVYSDGWCEQGGRASASEQNVTITLLKNYKDTNYSPIAISNTSGSAANYNSRVHTLTTSSFMFNSLINKACTCFWEAKGYIR